MPQLAQVNIARFARPIDEPANRPFIEALDGVNAEADGSEGFVWRLKGAGADAMDV